MTPKRNSEHLIDDDPSRTLGEQARDFRAMVSDAARYGCESKSVESLSGDFVSMPVELFMEMQEQNPQLLSYSFDSPSNASEMLTREEAAEYMGIATQTLANWASTNRHDLPFTRVGRSVRYRKSDVDAWINRQTVNPIQRPPTPPDPNSSRS